MSSSEKNTPSHRAYVVAKTEDGDDAWTEIGAVWPTKSGTSFSLKCKSEIVLTPATRVILRTVTAKQGGAA